MVQVIDSITRLMNGCGVLWGCGMLWDGIPPKLISDLSFLLLSCQLFNCFISKEPCKAPSPFHPCPLQHAPLSPSQSKPSSYDTILLLYMKSPCIQDLGTKHDSKKTLFDSQRLFTVSEAPALHQSQHDKPPNLSRGWVGPRRSQCARFLPVIQDSLVPHGSLWMSNWS